MNAPGRGEFETAPDLKLETILARAYLQAREVDVALEDERLGILYTESENYLEDRAVKKSEGADSSEIIGAATDLAAAFIAEYERVPTNQVPLSILERIQRAGVDPNRLPDFRIAGDRFVELLEAEGIELSAEGAAHD